MKKEPDLPVFEVAVSGSLWSGPYHYATDREAYEVSRVPERALRTLQRVGVVQAAKLHRQHGSLVRAWHLLDVAAIATVEAYKRCTGVDYEQAAADLIPTAPAIKHLFGSFAGFASVSELGNWRKQWRATLFVADDSHVYLSISDILRQHRHTDIFEQHRVDLDRPGDVGETPSWHEQKRHHFLMAIRNADGLMEVTRGEQGLVQEIDGATFEISINLHNVFADVELAAKKLRR